jgi:hypothetical protein
MNKKIVYLLIALVIVLGLYFILNKNTVSTLAVDEKDFHFSSTDKIDKIFIKNKFTKEFVILEKKEGNIWMVNNKHIANKFQINNLLKTLRQIRVKKPVSKNLINQVIKDFALNSQKVEIYENGKISKVFYVGNNTIDEMGTYFYMEKAKEPYVCHIPGFNGFLNTRFYTTENDWRTTSVFSSKADEIKSIDVIWTASSKQSFHIDNTDKEPIISTDNKVFENNKNINLNQLKSYLNLWENLSFDGFPINLKSKDIDSISKTIPLVELKLVTKKGETTTLRIHRKRHVS